MYQVKLSRPALAKLNRLRKTAKNKAISDRLQCIYLANQGQEYKEIADSLAINKNTVTNWIKIYREQGLAELTRPEDFDRRSSKIDPYVNQIRQDVAAKAIATLAELQDWIKKEYALEMEAGWLSRCCKKNFVYLTKRPG